MKLRYFTQCRVSYFASLPSYQQGKENNEAARFRQQIPNWSDTRKCVQTRENGCDFFWKKERTPTKVQKDKTEVHIIFCNLTQGPTILRNCFEVCGKCLYIWMQLYTLGSNKLSHQNENTRHFLNLSNFKFYKTRAWMILHVLLSESSVILSK